MAPKKRKSQAKTAVGSVRKKRAKKRKCKGKKHVLAVYK